MLIYWRNNDGNHENHVKKSDDTREAPTNTVNMLHIIFYLMRISSGDSKISRHTFGPMLKLSKTKKKNKKKKTKQTTNQKKPKKQCDEKNKENILKNKTHQFELFNRVLENNYALHQNIYHS